jgi:D-tyrosyl-tRNA(Tyr) deacylase
MKLVIQRVERARVAVDGNVVGKVGRGFLVFIGVAKGDTEKQADKLAKKMLGLRIFPDEDGKINRSLADVDGGLLIVSQFTLYADCRKGYRPGFDAAAAPAEAERLYEYFVGLCRTAGFPTETGVFGAHMEVSLVNQGPFTIILEDLPSKS